MLSDCNTTFISHMLAAGSASSLVSAVYTNPAIFTRVDQQVRTACCHLAIIADPCKMQHGCMNACPSLIHSITRRNSNAPVIKATKLCLMLEYESGCRWP